MKTKLALPADIAMEKQRQDEILGQVIRARNELAFQIFSQKVDVFAPTPDLIRDTANKSIEAAMLFMEASGMVSFVEGTAPR